MKTPVEKKIFNLEREHKIINPHKMQLLTMTSTDFKPFSVKPRSKTPKEYVKNEAPIAHKKS
jgi:hypothetical protein